MHNDFIKSGQADDAADGALQISRMLGEMDEYGIHCMFQVQEAALIIHPAFQGEN